MEEDREVFYCPKMYAWCDEKCTYVAVRGQNGIEYIMCSTDSSNCKMFRRKELFKKLAASAD